MLTKVQLITITITGTGITSYTETDTLASVTGRGNTTTNNITANQIIANDWLRTNGATGWYNNTYGGGFYMTDTTWIRTYNNKSFYQNSGTLRTDGTLQVNSGSTFQAISGGAVTVDGSQVITSANLPAYPAPSIGQRNTHYKY